jgi:hypothetical protein
MENLSLTQRERERERDCGIGNEYRTRKTLVTGSRKVRRDGGRDNLLRLVGIQTESNSEVYDTRIFPGFPRQEVHFYYKGKDIAVTGLGGP